MVRVFGDKGRVLSKCWKNSGKGKVVEETEESGKCALVAVGKVVVEKVWVVDSCGPKWVVR
jgi:hypothetical protein